MSTTVETQQRDRLVRFERDFSGQIPKGAPLYDHLSRVARPNIARTWSATRHETRIMSCQEGVVLCGGAALGIGDDGLVRHIRPYHSLRGFSGFLEKTIASGRILVRTKGEILLLVCGGKRTPGTPVFAVNPDEFTTDPTTGGHRIGEIIFTQPENPNLCLVAFRSFDDKRP